MSGAPRAILVAILGAIDDLQAGRSSLAEAQQQLAANASALDRSARELVQELRAVDADLERIRFGIPPDEQHPPADFRIDVTRAAAVLRLDPISRAAVSRLEPIRAMVATELSRAGD